MVKRELIFNVVISNKIYRGESFLFFDLDFDNFVINQINESHGFSL